MRENSTSDVHTTTEEQVYIATYSNSVSSTLGVYRVLGLHLRPDGRGAMGKWHDTAAKLRRGKTER